jgi:hypothetical protein
MKWMLMALACAAATPAFAAAVERPTDLPWAGDVDVSDWLFVGNSDVTLMFLKPAPAPADSIYPRVYVRFEEATPFDRMKFPSMASVEVDEIDCARQRTRIVEVKRYAQRNMKGQTQIDDIEAPEWKAETRGSFGAAILRKVCSTLL